MVNIYILDIYSDIGYYSIGFGYLIFFDLIWFGYFYRLDEFLSLDLVMILDVRKNVYI